MYKKFNRKQQELVDMVMKSVSIEELKNIIKFCENENIKLMNAGTEEKPLLLPVEVVKQRVIEEDRKKYPDFFELDPLCNHEMENSSERSFCVVCKKCGGWSTF